jgi:hypothetical protein
MSIKTHLALTSIILSSLVISSCTMIGSRVQNAPTAMPLHPDTHRHPDNRCTKSITHTHANGINDHGHRYSCESQGRSRGSAGTLHSHPANEMTRSMKHTHLNGENEHDHHYQDLY